MVKRLWPIALLSSIKEDPKEDNQIEIEDGGIDPAVLAGRMEIDREHDNDGNDNNNDYDNNDGSNND